MEEEYKPTQECNTQSQGDENSPQPTQEGKPPLWGRLVSLERSTGDFDLNANDFTLGRRAEVCSATFDDMRISGQHCRVFKAADNTIFIQDLSSNGTFVNGQKLGKGIKSVLKNGDQISLLKNNKKGPITQAPLTWLFYDVRVGVAEEPKCEIEKFYDFQKVIGTGNFSVVKLAINRESGVKTAVKIIDKLKYWHSPKTKEQILREIEILKRVKHDHIISVIDIFDTDRYLYIVLELATGGELFQTILESGSFSESKARRVFKQILAAVAYLHEAGIAHRDLKPENILFADQTPDAKIKITDFGLAKIIGEKEMMTTLCGTPQYVAPEIIIGAAGRKVNKDIFGYGKEVDMWSLGVILYVLLSGLPPFDQETRPMTLFEQIEKGAYEFPDDYWCHISASAKNLISQLMQVDPRKRLTVDQALRHPWLHEDAESKPMPSIQENMKSHLAAIKTSSTSSPVKRPGARNAPSETEDDGGEKIKRTSKQANDVLKKINTPTHSTSPIPTKPTQQPNTTNNAVNGSNAHNTHHNKQAKRKKADFDSPSTDGDISGKPKESAKRTKVLDVKKKLDFCL